jgi:SET family sugar efflux transporter-like MFS transporter
MALAHGILFPIGTAIFGQIFALNNLASQRHPGGREAIQATIRALMSAAFLLTLLVWTWGLGPGKLPVMSVYPVAALAACGLFAVIWAFWPKGGQEPWVERPSGLALRAALAELARPAIAARLICLGAMGGLPMLYIILTPLLFAQSPVRQTSDVALIVGLVAGFEVPFMLLMPRLAVRFSRQSLIAGGAGLYAVFVVLLALWSGTTHLIWVLPALAGLAAAPLLTLPISYWQDLMAGRPGTASALMALQKLAGDLISASVFAAGTLIGGYSTAALIGGAVAMAGGIGLIWLDRRG